MCYIASFFIMEKDAYVSLRLPSALAEQLDRAAAERGVARSSVVREAVIAYLAGSPRPPVRPMPAAEFARVWETLPHLTPEEAELFEADIRAARDSYPPEVDPWE